MYSAKGVFQMNGEKDEATVTRSTKKKCVPPGAGAAIWSTITYQQARDKCILGG